MLLLLPHNNRCYSYVGRNGGKQVLSLGEGCQSVGTIVHELGHAVGFYHEHQRQDRDDYIRIYSENVQQGLMDQFVKIPSRILIPGFDYDSVMLYGPLTFSKDGRSFTMLPTKENVVMKEVYDKYGLSSDDILMIQKLYQC